MRQRKRRKNRNRPGYQEPARRGRSTSVQCAHCLNFFRAKGLHAHLRSCALAAGGGSSALGDADGVLRSSFGFVAGNDNEDDDLSEDQGFQLDADDMADSDDGKHRMGLRPRPASAAGCVQHYKPVDATYVCTLLRTTIRSKRWTHIRR